MQAAYLLLLLLPAVLAGKITKDSNEDFDIENLSDKWESVDSDQQTDSTTDSKAIKEALEKFIKLKQSSASESNVPSNSFSQNPQFTPNSQFISQQDQQGFLDFNPNAQVNPNFVQLSASQVSSNNQFGNNQQLNHAKVAQFLNPQYIPNTNPTFNTGSVVNQKYSQLNQNNFNPTQLDSNQGNIAQFSNRAPGVQGQYSAQLSQFAQNQPFNTATLLSASNNAQPNLPLFLQSNPNVAQNGKPSDLEGFLKFLQAQETEDKVDDQAITEMNGPEMKAPPPSPPPPPPPPPPAPKPAPKPAPMPEYSQTDIHNPDSFLLKDNAEFTIARDNNGKPILLSDVDANGQIPAHMDYAQYAPAESHQVTYLHSLSNGKFQNVTSEDQDSRYFQLLNAQANGKFNSVSSPKNVNDFTPDFTTKQVFPGNQEPFEYDNDKVTFDSLRSTYIPSSSNIEQNFNEYKFTTPTEAPSQKNTGNFLAERPSFVAHSQNVQKGPSASEKDKSIIDDTKQNNYDYTNIPFEYLKSNTKIPKFEVSKDSGGFIPTKDPNIFFQTNKFPSQRYVEKKTNENVNLNKNNHFLSNSPLTSVNLEKSEQQGQNLDEILSFRTNNKAKSNKLSTEPYYETRSTYLPSLNPEFFRTDGNTFSTVLSETISTTGSSPPNTASFSTFTPTETSVPLNTVITTPATKLTTIINENDYTTVTDLPSTLKTTAAHTVVTEKQTTSLPTLSEIKTTTRLPKETFITQSNSPFNTQYTTTIPITPNPDITKFPSTFTTPFPTTLNTQSSKTTPQTTTQSFTGDGFQLHSVPSDTSDPQGSTSQRYLSLPPGLFLQNDNSGNSNLPQPSVQQQASKDYLSGYSQQGAQSENIVPDTQFNPTLQNTPPADQGYLSLPPALFLQNNDANQYNIDKNNQQSIPSNQQAYPPVLQQTQSDVPRPVSGALNGVASYNEEDLTPIHLPADNCTAVFEVLEDRQSVLGVQAMPGEADCRLTFVSPSTSRLALQVVGLDLPQGDDACKLASVSIFSQNDGRNLLLNQLCGSVKESPVMLTEGQSALVTVQSEMGTQRPGFTVIAFLW